MQTMANHQNASFYSRLCKGSYTGEWWGKAKETISNYPVICFNLNQSLICCHSRLSGAAKTNVLCISKLKAKLVHMSLYYLNDISVNQMYVLACVYICVCVMCILKVVNTSQ